LIERLRRDPRPLVLAVVALAIIGAFFAVVAPLFSTSSAPSADLAGAIPSTASANAPLEIDLGLDNTSYTLISAICVSATVAGPLLVERAVFEGLDNEPFHNGRVCGGGLNGQETISVKMFLAPQGPGTATIAFAPTQGTRMLGNPLRGTIALLNQ